MDTEITGSGPQEAGISHGVNLNTSGAVPSESEKTYGQAPSGIGPVAGPTLRNHLAETIITKGLAFPFSPNHLQRSSDIADIESKMASHIREGNWNALQLMIANEKVADKEALYVAPEDLRNFFEPLTETFSENDWRMLTLLCKFHDVGRVERFWAERHGLDMSGTPGFAHDFEGATLLTNNPQILDDLELSDQERELLITLVKWHTLSGQFFFGEGNLDGYQSLMALSAFERTENALNLSRVHGLLDVMAARGNRFVKPILTSHIALNETLEKARGTDLNSEYEELVWRDTPSAFLDAGAEFGLSPISVYRLMRLAGFKDVNKGFKPFNKAQRSAYDRCKISSAFALFP